LTDGYQSADIRGVLNRTALLVHDRQTADVVHGVDIDVHVELLSSAKVVGNNARGVTAGGDVAAHNHTTVNHAEV
jgi:hypothetical protein